MKKYWKIAAAAAFLTVAGFCYGIQRGVPEEISGPAMTENGYAETIPPVEITEAVPETPAQVFLVHICGEVKIPGVYALEEGSRIFQAVEAAGGLTEEAAADVINLAAPVLDGMRVWIPGKTQVQGLAEQEKSGLLEQYAKIADGMPGADKTAGSAAVNINTAGPEELTELSGIGKARAEEIVRYREENGGFQKIEEIMNVPGIKDALFQKIKDSITV